jgi:3D (Asp-Asp-Asp) domain-containing protein
MQREITVKDTVVYLLLSLIIAFCVTITIKVYAMEEAVTEITSTTETTTVAQETTTEEETTDIPLTTVKFEDIPDLTELGTFKLTAYCPCHDCCHYKLDDGTWNCGGEGSEKCKHLVENPKTSIGKTPKSNNTVAVDPRKVPYGTKLYINGKYYEASDCGGAVKDNVIDIYFDTHEEAVNFGSKYAKVFEVN